MENKKYGIVTGASRGLGAAIAEELAREGYDLVITYHTQAEKAEAVKERLKKEYGVNIETYKLAIENEDEVIAFRSWVEENMGKGLVVLVNNAGIYCNVPVSYTHLDVYKRQVVHLGDQVTGKDRREQRLNHCSKSGKVHIGKRLSEVQPV